eukprot:gene3236-4050_t
MKNNNLSYLEGSTTKEHKLIDLSINQILSESVKKYPNKNAIIIENSNNTLKKTTYTYTELENEINYLSYGLIDLGIRKGDYIAIWSPNRLEPLLLYISLAKIGAISVNLYPYFASEEFNEIMALTQCKALFFWDEGIILDYSGVDYLTESMVSVHDPYQILLTSGSTGKHKLIVQSQYSFINNSEMIIKRVGYRTDDVMGNVGKMYHNNDKFNPLVLIRAIEKHRISMIVGPPSIYFGILNHPEFSRYNISTLKKGTMGAFPLSPALAVDILEIGFPVVQLYGMSETLMTFSTNYNSTTKQEFIETVGKIFPYC